MHFALFSFVLWVRVVAGTWPGNHYGPYDDQATVRVGYSTIKGLIDHQYPSVRQFLGIPFAQPPIRHLRWERPQRSHLSSSVDATQYGKPCSQFNPTIPSIFTEDVPEYNVASLADAGEDCLTLSIWTPLHARKLPVLVFFYGGGWYTGGQDIPYLNPTQWIQKAKDLIVVIPNFRGNIFGYPNARGASEQNLGLLDQRLAVEWVRDNIASFGGDPHKITLWGQSSGAEAVDIYNYAWHDDPIVHGLIMDSGTALIEALLEPGLAPRYSNFSYVAAKVGCGDASDAKQELACMKEVDAATIQGVLADNYNSGSTEILAFGPSVDNRLTFYDYAQRSRDGKQTKLPAIIGTNKNEGIAFAPYNATDPDQAVADFWTQTLFLCPSYNTARLRAGAEIPTYRYLYAGNFSNVSPRSWMGAYHGSEQPLLFGTYGNYRGPSTKQETAVSEAMQDAWRAFANDPTAGLARQNWPRFTLQEDVVRTFGEGQKVAENIVGGLSALEAQC